MSNKKLGVIGLIIAALVFGGYVIMSRISKGNDSAATSQSTAEDPAEDSVELGSYTLAEVATHKTTEDCWIVINDKVYDLTDYIEEHNGGSVITQACGIDGSSLFNQRETSSGQSVGSGTPHNSSARSDLEDLEVGTLKK